MPQSKVREQVEQGRGAQFDPRFEDFMLSMIDDDISCGMREIREERGRLTSPVLMDSTR